MAGPVRLYCDVVIPHARLDELTYSCESVTPALAPGDCVEVRLRGRRRLGIVVRLLASSPVSRVLPVERVVERGLVDPGLLALVDWVGGYYASQLGEALGAALPRNICGYRPRRVAEPASAHPPASPPAPDPAVEFGRFGVWFSGRATGREELVAGFAGAAGRHGRVLVLVPERELARWAAALSARCGVMKYHAGLSVAVRKQAWRRLQRGEPGAVVGVRSAVLAPLGRTGGIAVVDEHLDTYKEERHPRFHARDVAVVRAQRAGCPVLLLSRTPSLETFHNLETGHYRLLDPLSEPSARPGTMVVDLRRHRDDVLSPLLVRQLESATRAGSALLYVNRHGLSRNVCCRECGRVVECADCLVPAVLHPDRTLVCGSCGRRWSAPETCPACGGSVFRLRAPGVELVAREVERRLGDRVKVHRLTGAGGPDIAALRNGVVVATRALLSRMWPASVRLVGVVNLDYDLVLPDFRARERAFQLLAEMERRSRELGATTLVQTWRPEEPALRAALEQDSAGFARVELDLREKLGMPPFRRLALVEAKGRSVGAVRSHLERLARVLGRQPGVDVLGPAPVVHARAAGKTTWRLLVRGSRERRLGRLLGGETVEGLRLDVRVDVDPVSLF